MNENRTVLRLLIASLVSLGVILGMGIILIFTLKNPSKVTIQRPSQPEQNTSNIASTETQLQPVKVVDGIDVTTGFIAEGDFNLVRTTCTACHSAKLVLQNRATREGWKEMIVWMQKNHKLWDLGENEDKILEYLANHYGPVSKGRRDPVAVENWYEIR